MKLNERTPPRKFLCGPKHDVEISDCGDLALEDDEMVALKFAKRSHLDIVKKDWGFYGTPSLNARLKREGFLAFLSKSHEGKFYILLAHRKKMFSFKRYLKKENHTICANLSNL